jgi:hopanoid-associated phosphorylase
MLGVVTGMLAEARCLRPGETRFICTGGDAARARQGAARLVAQGVEALVSFGLAGGLAPSVAPGALLLPEVVVLPSGRQSAPNQVWRRRLSRLAEDARMAPLAAPLAGSDELVDTAPAKRALFEATQALAVDMESHAVAETADAAGLPYMVVRAVADTHDEALPAAARAGLGPEGRLRPLAVLCQLLRDPRELRPVLRLGRESGKALAALRRVAALAPDLAFV